MIIVFREVSSSSVSIVLPPSSLLASMICSIGGVDVDGVIVGVVGADIDVFLRDFGVFALV
jgi:hypothetical protein